MHKLEDLKNMLCDQLEEYADEELTAGTLDVVDKLTHTIKNLDKIISKYYGEDGYSNNYNGYYRDDYMRNGSYARGRGRNAKRDGLGRYSSDMGYSRDEGMISELHAMMEDAPDEKTRQKLQKFIQRMEQM